MSTIFSENVSSNFSLNMIKKKKKSQSCLSCRRLKIKCDRQRPSCEYCDYRGKTCSYPEDSEKSQDLDIIEVNNTSMPLIEVSLVSVSGLMGLTKSETQLLCVYDAYYTSLLGLQVGSARHKIWEQQIPKIWCESEIIRNSIFCISSIALWGVYDLNTLNEVYIAEDSQVSLYSMTGLYFQRQLQSLNYIISKITTPEFQQRDKTETEIGEIIIMNYVFFVFCCMHPHSIVPLINFLDEGDLENVQGPDILAIVQGFRACMNTFSEHIIQSKFAEILFLEERKIMTPRKNLNYKIVLFLKQSLEVAREYILESDYLVFKDVIAFLELSIYRSFTFGYVVPLYRWLFSLGNRIIYLIRSKDVFALKLIFTYAIFCQMTRFNVRANSNVWLKFINQYREMGLCLINGPQPELSALIWWDSYDQKLYDMMLKSDMSYQNIDDFAGLMELLSLDEAYEQVGPMMSTSWQ